MKLLTNPLVSALCLMAFAGQAAAQDAAPAFEVLTTPAHWGTFELDFKTHYSKSRFGFSQWKCDEFATTKTLKEVNPFTDMRCGWEFEGTASVQSLSPVVHKVSRVSAFISTYNSTLTAQCLRAVRLLYGTQADLSDARVVEYPGYFAGGKEFQFEIESPERMCYYRLELECDGHGKSSSNDFYAGLSYIKFYADAEEDARPVVWESESDGTKTCNVMAEAGVLHIVCKELDADDNIVADWSPTQGAARADDGIDWTDTSWINPAGEPWEAVTVNAPRTPGHKMAIRAKTELADGTFSPERQLFYTTEGIFTSVDTPVCDAAAAAPVYYTLQGTRVSETKTGIYIRVANGRAEKVAF